MAKYIYPAIFTSEVTGYSVVFPDLESCYTQGDDLQDAYDMAQDILCLTLYKMEENRVTIPKPSSPKVVKTNKESFISLISCDTVEYRKLNDNKAIKKTLSVPSWLNTLAEREGINFSAVLQDALKEQLHIDDGM